MSVSTRTEDMSWPTPADAGHSYTVGFAAQVAELVVAKIKDRLATAEADLTRIAAALKALPTV